MEIYITTDTHINHERLKTLGAGRPDDYEERILNGLRLIPDKALFIHLGDVALGKDSEGHARVLEATKQCSKRILVRGNHDNRSYAWYYKQGWDIVLETMRIRYEGKEILLTHMPVLKADADYTTYNDVDINIHGHLHGANNRANRNIEIYDKGYHYDAAPDTHKYLPLHIRRIIGEVMHTRKLQKRAAC